MYSQADEDGMIAKAGTCNEALLSALLTNEFFSGNFPKTTGPELFNLKYVENAIKSANITTPSVFDLLATLTLFSAETITDAIKKLFEAEKFDEKTIAKVKIYASGGGARNPLLMQMIRELLPTPQYATTDDLHINPDAKEAVLFALLANECLAGGKTDFGKRQGVHHRFHIAAGGKAARRREVDVWRKSIGVFAIASVSRPPRSKPRRKMRS